MAHPLGWLSNCHFLISQATTQEDQDLLDHQVMKGAFLMTHIIIIAGDHMQLDCQLMKGDMVMDQIIIDNTIVHKT